MAKQLLINVRAMFKKLLGLLNPKQARQQIFKQCSIVSNKPVIDHKTLTETGDFIKASDFETIWIAENINDDYNASDSLTDDDYLDYKLWEDLNADAMYKKHSTDSHVFRGKNPNIIFHGGCLGCMSQRVYGFERCKGCKYFRSGPANEDLRITGEKYSEMNSDELRKLIGGK